MYNLTPTSGNDWSGMTSLPTFNPNDLKYYTDAQLQAPMGGGDATFGQFNPSILPNAWNISGSYPEFGGQGMSNVLPYGDPNSFGGLVIKGSQGTGTRIPYTLQNGQYVPNMDQSAWQQQAMNTNPDNSWIPTALAMYGGAMGLQNLVGPAGAVADAGAYGGAANAGEALTAGGTAAGATAAGSSLPAWLTGAAGKIGTGLASTAIGRAIFGGGSQGGNSGGGTMSGGLTGIPAIDNLISGGGGSSLPAWISALMGAQANNSAAGSLSNLYDSNVGRANAFYDPLKNVQQDPSQFLNSQYFKSIQGPAQQLLDRQAAQKGTLSNPTEAAKQLNDWTAGQYNNYVSGLNQSYNTAQSGVNSTVFAKAMGDVIKSQQWNPALNILGNTGYQNRTPGPGGSSGG